MRLALFALALTAAGCTTARPAEGDAAAASEPVVTLERTVCYGRCPAYTVAAYADGRVVWTGTRFVGTEGPAEWRVAPSAVAGLVARAAAIDHAGYPDRLSGPEVCEALVSDLPSATTSVRVGGVTSRVERDGGCMRFAGKEALTAFEAAIDTALETAPRIAGADPSAPR